MSTEYGSRLRAARKNMGLSVVKAAGQAGVSPSVWRNVERGTTYVGGTAQPYHTSESTLARMALAVGLDPQETVELAGLDPARIPWKSLGRDDGTGTGSGVALVFVPDGATPEEVLERVKQWLDSRS